MYPFTRSAPPVRRRCAFSAAILVLMANPFAEAHAEPLSFDNALSLALRDAPAFAAHAARLESMRLRVTPAGQLPDPILVLGLDNFPIQGADRFSLSDEAMTMKRIGVAQAFPNRGKRDARTEAARWRVELAEAQTRITQVTVLRDTAVAWIGLETVERQLAQIDALVGENRLLKSAVVARLSATPSAAVESVAPRLEAAIIEERRDDLRARRTQAVATLRRYIGDAADSPIAGSAPEWPIDGGTLAHNLHQHPELTAFGPQAGLLTAELAEAQAAKKPDWALELAYQNRGAEFGDMISLQVSFDLPVFGGARQNPLIAAKHAEQSALTAEREVMARDHAWTLETELAEFERVSNAARRQRDVLVPLAIEKVTLTLAAWRGTQGTLTDLLAARRERIDAELKAIALEGERKQLAARLHYGYGNQVGGQS